MDKLLHTQKTLAKYFAKFSDEDYVHLVDCFCFNTTPKTDADQKRLDTFIDDNGLREALDNLKHDKEHPDAYFLRCSASQRQTIENVNISLCVLSHSRLRFKLGLKP